MASVEVEQLQEAMELGAVRERQRIIALLQEDDRLLYENGECQLDNHWPEMCNCRVISLIKGEN